MFINHNKNSDGFTLLETLVAVAIGVAVSLIMVISMSFGLKSIRASNDLERLHADSVFIANILGYWIKQARVIDSPDSATLAITLYDSTVKTFTHTGDNLELDGRRVNTEDSLVEDWEFTELANSARFSFTLRSPKSGIKFSATSTVARRN